MSTDKYTIRQLLNVEACTRCGQCTLLCSAYNANNDLKVSPAKKIELLSKRIRSKTIWGRMLGKKYFSDSDFDELARAAYECTLCSRCEVQCPINIDLQKIWVSLRADLVDEQKGPEVLQMLKERLMSSRNISFDTNQGRADWINQVPDIPEDKYIRGKAEVIYFVGCVSSFSPRVFKIPRSVAQIFKLAKVDFGLLGDEEWCCGFPLLSSGYKNEFFEFAIHNIEKINDTGAKILVTSCPSCYHMWSHIYTAADISVKMNFKVMHLVQYLYKLALDKEIKLYHVDAKVTYHDPCDLGRNSGIYEEPRNLIKLIPGVKFIELSENPADAVCCGGGGNVEAVNKQLSEDIAAIKAKAIVQTGADIAVTACQQCVRTIMAGLKNKNSKIKTMDISELVLMSATGAK